ncbi:MAG: hypothetical protein JWN40_2237 [Phycisphaerales bacterium]|nr:hypothetical protein [Phycisphaerales bacterium]
MRFAWFSPRNSSWPISLIALVGAFVLPIAQLGIVRASSIFDDDWKPATRPVQAAPVTPKPIAATDPPPELTRTPKAVVPVRPDLAVKAAASRRPVPNKPELVRTRQQLREVFATELADRSIPGRRALATKLLGEAARCADKPADQFALLAAAQQAATEGKELSLCFEAVDALAAAFEVDRLAIEGQLIADGGCKAEVPTVTSDNCRVALGVFDQLVHDEDYDTASRLSGPLQQAAAADAIMKTVVARRVKELELLRVNREKFIKAMERLKGTPGDAAARQEAGVYLCFCKGDWEAGLPMLAGGTNAETKKAAAAEIAGADAVEQTAAAWAAVMARQPEAYRPKVQQHAAALYRQALVGATGLQKRQLEAAVQKVLKGAAPVWVDVLRNAAPERDGASGNWSRAGSALAVNTDPSRLELPYSPPEEYTFRVDFTTAGEHTVFMGITKSGKSFQWIMGNVNNQYAGFQQIDGQDAHANRSTLKLHLEAGRRYSAVIEVRNGRLTAYLDGQLLSDYPTDYRELGEHPNAQWRPRDSSRLAIGTFHAATTFHRIEVIELSGPGTMLSDRKDVR